MQSNRCSGAKQVTSGIPSHEEAFFRVTNPQTPSQKLKVVLAAKAVHIQYILCTKHDISLKFMDV